MATIVSVSRPDTSDISPMLLSYTIEFQYKQAVPLSLSPSLFVYVHVYMFVRVLYTYVPFLCKMLKWVIKHGVNLPKKIN